MLLVNWDKRTYVDLQKEKKKAKPDADVEVGISAHNTRCTVILKRAELHMHSCL